jgi:ArsR family transcriptional regulator, arsenate/arsenite/antimonite-responsive transcriptional repressor
MPSTTTQHRVRAARLFHALSDETRLAIVERLRGGERCVCDLTGDLDAAQSRLSFHLKVLKEAGLVHDRPRGKWTYYTLCTETIGEVDRAVDTLRPRRPSRSLPVRCC